MCLAHEKIRESDAERGNVGDDEHGDYKCNEIRHNTFYDLFKLEPGNIRGNIQAGADRRGYHSNAHDNDEDYTDMIRIHADAGENRKKNGRKKRDRGRGIQESADDQQQYVEEEEQDILVAGDGEQRRCDELRDALTCENKAEGRDSAHYHHDDGRGNS